MSAPKDSIRLDFAKDKACRGLHEVPWDYRSKELFDWSLSIAGDDNGRSEVLFINLTTDPHHYVFLGTNIGKGVHKACRIVNGEQKVAWLAFEK